MAKITATKSVFLVLITDSNDNELEFSKAVVVNRPEQKLYIKVKVGPIKFSVYTDVGVSTDSVQLETGEELFLTIVNGARNLKYKGTNPTSFIAAI